jgi:hypothetical protein
MKSIQKGIDPQEASNEKLLMTIIEREKQIAKAKEDLKQLEESKKYLFQQAIDKKIEKAGMYKLVCKPVSRRSTDLEAVKTMLTTDQILEIASITLKDAGKYLTEKQIAACVITTVTECYKVVELYEPGGIDKCKH